MRVRFNVGRSGLRLPIQSSLPNVYSGQDLPDPILDLLGYQRIYSIINFRYIELVKKYYLLDY